MIYWLVSSPNSPGGRGSLSKPVKRYSRLAKRGAIDPRHLRLWSFGTDIRTLSPSLFMQWIGISSHASRPSVVPSGWNCFIATTARTKPRAHFPQRLAKTLLLHRDFFESRERGGMDDYNWSEVAQKLIAQEPAFGCLCLKVCFSVGIRTTRPSASLPNRAASILFKIVGANPEGSWEVISKLIADLKAARGMDDHELVSGV